MTQDSALDWSAIDTVLLDMDGTLLDLRFDNWFWLELIPRRYAAEHGLSEHGARAALAPKFSEVKGTLQWYCIDYWSRELRLDIPAIKREALGAVGFLPGAQQFLTRLKDSGKRRALVSNAHPTTLRLKCEHVGLNRYFDVCYSTHPFAYPKEHASFWPQLQQQEGFAPARTLFVDDSMSVLNAAREFGIGWIRAVRRPDSAQPPQPTGDFAAVDRVADLM